jgi:hypothetical protein
MDGTLPTLSSWPLDLVLRVHLFSCLLSQPGYGTLYMYEKNLVNIWQVTRKSFGRRAYISACFDCHSEWHTHTHTRALTSVHTEKLLLVNPHLQVVSQLPDYSINWTINSLWNYTVVSILIEPAKLCKFYYAVSRLHIHWGRNGCLIASKVNRSLNQHR